MFIFTSIIGIFHIWIIDGISRLYYRIGSTGALHSPNKHGRVLTSDMRYDMSKEIKIIAGQIMFSQISDSPLTVFENIYNQALHADDKDEPRGISQYD